MQQGQPVPALNQMRKKLQHYSYGLTDMIFKGNYSSIFKGINQKNLQPVSIKVINIKSIQSKQGRHMLQNQIQALKSLSFSNNILKVYDILQTLNNCYIITQFCNQGDLDNFLNKRGKIDEKQAIPIFRGIVNGFKILVQSKFLHRDLKPVNILLKDKVAKIADFSYAKRQGNNPVEKDIVGTPAYLSPQALNQNIFTVKNDIWALGCILYQMLHGQLPWPIRSNTKQQQVNNIRNNPLILDKKLSQDLRDFIKKCLVFDDKLRLNGVDFFHHPFITRISQQNQILLMALKKNISEQYSSKQIKNRDANSCNIIKQNFSMDVHEQINKKNINTRHKTQKQFQAQINYMRYIYRFLQLLLSTQELGKWSFGLKFLATKQMLSLISSLKKAIYQNQDCFNFLCWNQFLRNDQKIKNYKSVLQQYEKRYEKNKKQFQTVFIPLAQKDKSLNQLANTNYVRSQLLSILSIKYALQQCRSLWQQICRGKMRLSEDQYKSYFAKQALRLDYIITFYQLNCYLIDNFNDPDYFLRTSKIDIIIQYKPSILEPSMKSDFEEKLKLLQIIH